MPRLRVLLVGNDPMDGQQSMQRFAALLRRGLQEAGVEVEYTAPSPWLSRWLPRHSALGKWLGYLDKLLIFPLLLLRRVATTRPDLVHLCDHSNAVYTSFLRRVPHLATCHDLLAIRSALGEIPANRTRWSGRCLQALIQRGLKQIPHVVCVSEATRQDALRILALCPSRLSLIPNALNDDFAPMPASEALPILAELFGGPAVLAAGYLLHVGGNQWYKNRMGVLRIVAHLKAIQGTPPWLVLAGQPWTPEMTRFVEQQQLQVIRLESIANRQLMALYSQARALVFPSLAEGFGWPVIEAQACGCPVVCSNAGPLPEVAGPAALLCDPTQELTFAQTILSLLQDSTLRQQLVVAGLANAQRYSPAAMIQAYLQRYFLSTQHPDRIRQPPIAFDSPR